MNEVNFRVIIIALAVIILIGIYAWSYVHKTTQKLENKVKGWKETYKFQIVRQQDEITRLTALLDSANDTCDRLRDNYDYISANRVQIDERIKEEYNKKEEELRCYAKAKNDAIDAAYQIKADNFNKLLEEIKTQGNLYQALLFQTKQLNNESNSREKATIHLTQEAKDDIEYIYSISSRFHHPDILYKLIWSEYVQKPLNEMLKNNSIGEVSGIYKITNIQTEKAYIGRSVNVKKRLQDHVKSAIGISTIADQAIHHAMKEEGLWNWSFELLEQVPKELLPEKEKQYIELLATQDYGYNKNGGG